MAAWYFIKTSWTSLRALTMELRICVMAGRWRELICLIEKWWLMTAKWIIGVLKRKSCSTKRGRTCVNKTSHCPLIFRNYVLWYRFLGQVGKRIWRERTSSLFILCFCVFFFWCDNLVRSIIRKNYRLGLVKGVRYGVRSLISWLFFW